jgi:hypothetical protein
MRSFSSLIVIMLVAHCLSASIAFAAWQVESVVDVVDEDITLIAVIKEPVQFLEMIQNLIGFETEEWKRIIRLATDEKNGFVDVERYDSILESCTKLVGLFEQVREISVVVHDPTFENIAARTHQFERY